MALTALSNFVVMLEKAFSGAWHQAFGGNVKGRSASLALDSALSNYTSLTLGQAYPSNPSKAPPTLTNINGSLGVTGRYDGGYVFGVQNLEASSAGVYNASVIKATAGDDSRSSKIYTATSGSNKTRFELCADGTIFMPDNTAFPTTPQTGDVVYHSTRQFFMVYDGAAWQAIGPSKACMLSYYRNAAANIGAAFTDIIYDTSLFDVGANFSNTTGIFTAPTDGKYFIQATCYVGTAVAAGKQLTMQITDQNGTELRRGGSIGTSAIGVTHGVNVTDVLQLAAGSQIKVRGLSADSGTGVALQTGRTFNVITIYRVNATN